MALCEEVEFGIEGELIHEFDKMAFEAAKVGRNSLKKNIQL